jgi:hypothetical protein
VHAEPLGQVEGCLEFAGRERHVGARCGQAVLRQPRGVGVAELLQSVELDRREPDVRDPPQRRIRVGGQRLLDRVELEGNGRGHASPR